MRCWVCYWLIALPDIINGKVGEPGMIRRREAKPTEPGALATEFTCSRCGSRYIQTTALLEAKSKAPAPAVDARTEAEMEADRVWKGQ